MLGAYILVVIGVAVWSLAVPFGNRMSVSLQRGITVFGGAFLLAVCCLELLPETASIEDHDVWPFVAILVGFLVQQVLDGLSAHAEHGHTEDGFTMLGLMIGLCLHAFLEGIPLVWQGKVMHGLLWGIVVHNIPVALIIVSLATNRGWGFGKVLAMLVVFGIMSPIGSISSLYVIRPNPQWHCILTGLVVGVLLHVSSSILFDHKRNHFSWLNIGIMTVAFALAALITL
ncbi:MAG: hypothetical protein IJ761_05150 [Bacteroidales bacterium]|nr:hypothetical protein [Bacteroidales bacterium]